MTKLASESGKATSDADKLLRMPAHELSKMIRTGKLTSQKLCEVYIERIKQVQPYINAVCEDRFEKALSEAASIDQLLARYRAGLTPDGLQTTISSEELELVESPLVGVPISIKESIAVCGMKNSCGLWDRREYVAEGDAVVVRNVKRFGLIPICTTNVPELTLFWSDCRNKVYGQTNNPYNLARVPGASSGGEGALIGAGASLLGIGTDIGGSLRNPAHYSGIMSHKPSPFLVSPEGNFPAVKESRLRMFTMGPMSRYASDLRHLLRILVQDKDNPKRDSYLTHQPKTIAETRQRVIEQLGQPFDLKKVKFFYGRFREVGFLKSLFGSREQRVEPSIMDSQQRVLDYFKSNFDSQVEQIDLDKYLDKSFTIWIRMVLSGGTVDREQAFEENESEKVFGITSAKLELVKFMLGLSKHTLESLATIMFGFPTPKSREKAYAMCEKWEQIGREFKEQLETILGDFGCVIIPTLPTVAHKHSFALMRTNEARFPWLWNVVQFPVTHVTMGLDDNTGLPFGLSVASRPGNDALTIAVAEEIEKAFGGWTPPKRLWADCAP